MKYIRRRLDERGFTLIEVMITVAIVAILAVIAYPFYTGQMEKARRADAQTSLEQMALNQAKWRANNTTYTATIANVWDNFDGTTAKSLDEHYDLAIVGGSVSATGFEMTASPVGAQAGDGCGTFAIDEDGAITDDASYADAVCWRR